MCSAGRLWSLTDILWRQRTVWQVFSSSQLISCRSWCLITVYSCSYCVAGVQTGVLDMVGVHFKNWISYIWSAGGHCVGRVRNKRREAGHKKEDPGGGDPPSVRWGDLEERLGSRHPQISNLSLIWQSHPYLTKVAKRLSSLNLTLLSRRLYWIWSHIFIGLFRQNIQQGFKVPGDKKQETIVIFLGLYFGCRGSSFGK